MAREIRHEDLDFAALLRPDDYLVWGQAAAEPTLLTETLALQQSRLPALTAFIGMSFSSTPARFADGPIRFQSYCGTGDNRALERAGRLEILPVHYSELADHLLKKVGVLLLSLAPASPEGHYSFGLAHEYLVPLVKRARLVIAEVNDRIPWTHGDRGLTGDDIDILVRTSRPPPTMREAPAGDVERCIARRVAGLIDDGATLQSGIGTLPNIILDSLTKHQNLGLHSGALLDGAAALVESGALTNARKGHDEGVSVAGMALGGQRLHDLIRGRAEFVFRPSTYTHNPAVIEKLNRFTAINSAIEVDLGGQANTEVAGGRYVGAIGGALDFVRGAHRSRGGLPIVALPAVATVNGERRSRIVGALSGPATIPRSDAGIVVTEFGIADLRGTTLRERKRRLIDVAAPEFRAALEGHALAA